MSEQEREDAARAGDETAEEAEVRRVLAAAGPRETVPAGDLAAIRAAAHDAWRRRYGAAARARRRWGWLAAAAALAVAVGLRWWPAPETAAPAATAAVVERVYGVVRWREDGGAATPLLAGAAGRSLPVGARLETGDGAAPGRLALRLPGGNALRLDAGTRARLVSATHVDLASGAVYVDSGGAPGAPAISVQTPAGVVREIGTRFEVRVLGSGAGAVSRVRVREGAVELALDAAPTAPVRAAAGEEVAVRGGGVERHPAPAWGRDWQWVLDTAPVPAIEGLGARAFLDWMAAESGRRLVLDADAARVAAETVLHGSVEHLSPDQALSVVLASCGLVHETRGGELVVRRVAATPGR